MTDDEVVVEIEAASEAAAVGRVIDAGPGGRHLLGARVVVGTHQPCGDCDVCRRGGAPVCPAVRTIDLRAADAALRAPAESGLASDASGPTVTARARWVLVLDEALHVPGPAAALLGGPAALAYAMYARAGVGPGDRAVVIGDGAVARLLVDVLFAKGVTPIVWTANADLATWAAGRGAAIARSDADARAALAALGVRPAKLFACDRGDAAAARAIALAGPRAVVAILAGAAQVDIAAALAREVTVLGVVGAHPDLLPELAALAVRGEIDLEGARI